VVKITVLKFAVKKRITCKYIFNTIWSIGKRCNKENGSRSIGNSIVRQIILYLTPLIYEFCRFFESYYMFKTNKDVLVVFWVIRLKDHCFHKQTNK